ncbi:RNA polymerase sigma factor [Sphingobacterium spiritivorum]|uniref:RNA polymerase sigma factor n=1 Tax=Sphingobacterium spiritivorum TaxID=258 RepID=UPI003DA2425B
MPKETDYTILSDQQLMILIGQDDYAGFTELYLRHIQELTQYARRIHIDEEESNDFVQEVFASLWMRRHDLHVVTPLAWLYMSVRKQMLHSLRKQKNRDKYIENLASYLNPFYDPVLDVIQEKQVWDFIERETAKLPSKMQQIFRMSRQDFLSHREIAEELQLSEKTVKKQINNVLKIFRSKISPRQAEVIVIISYLMSQK